MKKLTSMLVLGATALSFGQNARTDAMAGTSVQGDMSRILTRGAVEMFNYKNNAQMSAGTSLHGNQNGEFNFIGTKTIGDKFIIGATVDTDQYDNSNFYVDAWNLHENAVGSNLSEEDGSMTDQNEMPNLLFGFEVNEGLAFGAELYLDANRYKGDTDLANDPDNGGVASNSETTEYISNKGFVISAAIGDELIITPHFGMGFPRNKYEFTQTVDGVSGEILIETETGISMDAGADVAWPAGNVEMEAGFGWGMEKYQFTGTQKNDAGSVTTKDPNIHSKNTFDLLYGVTGVLNDKLLWVVEYRGSYGIDRTNNTDESQDPNVETNTDVKDLDQEFALAFERPVKGFWIFDGLTPRAGFVYASGKDKNATTVESGDKADTNDKWNYGNGMNLTTGFGLTKGRATIDVAANFGDWDASFTGPTTASATLTVDFGKKSGASKPAPFAEEESGSFGIE